MKYLTTIIVCIVISLTSCAQTKKANVGGLCEGCEAANEFGDIILKNSDTIKGFYTGTNKIKISGTVFKSDGKTPAKDVILYVYHTDETGKYPTTQTSKGWESRHGYLRTWLKTNTDGYYEFYTLRPASYPNSSVPQHIHITVKEPELMPYYIEDFYFSDDPNLTSNIINRTHSRGGSGVIELQGDTELKVGSRDIVLGLNIPNY